MIRHFDDIDAERPLIVNLLIPGESQYAVVAD